MAELSPYELKKRGDHILKELDGYSLDHKIELLRYLLASLEEAKRKWEK